MAKALTQAQRDKIIELHKAGLSRNDIARTSGVSAGTVTNVCRAAGRTFDRSITKDATKAKQVDLAEARMNLARRMDVAANQMLDMLDKPFQVYSFGGRDNVFASETLTSPPVEARRTIITSSAIVFDKISRIVEKDNGGLESTVGVLDALSGNLAAAAALLRSADVTPASDADGA